MYRDIFKNCLDVADYGAGYLPMRFTKKQLDYFASQGAEMKARARFGAGVSMSFFTDTRIISFDYEVMSKHCNTFVFDIYENDVLVESAEKTEIRGRLYFVRQSSNISKVTIYLPNQCEVFIKNISIGEYMPYIKGEGKSILMLGDSITQGLHTTMPSLCYTAIVERFFDGEIINQGMSGCCFDADGLEDALPFSPDFITVAYGANDVDNLELPQIKNGAQAYFAKIKEAYKGVPVFIILPIWRGDLEKSKAYEKKNHLMRGMIEDLAMECGFCVIDGYELVPHMKKFFADGLVHPNELGFGCYATELIKRIKG